MVGPGLPARKAGGRRANAPARHSNIATLPSSITLADGTEIPVKIPPGMPHAQGLALIEYLKSNPEAAKQAHAQASQILRNPGMTDAFTNLRASPGTADPDMAEKYAKLKDDPELKDLFAEVARDGPGALQKYWDNTELMSKVSQKVGGVQPRQAPSSGMDPNQAKATLHGAAKLGDAEAVTKHLDEGKHVDEVNERGITALGVAVGFNRVEVVRVLLSRGADLDKRDAQGNTALHYAAGYGRKEVAEQLLQAGADLLALNKNNQKPVDAARCNNEKTMVQFLTQLEEEKQQQKA